MQKVLQKSIPFFLLLLLFSCAKENDLFTPVPSSDKLGIRKAADVTPPMDYDENDLTPALFKICPECPIDCDMPCSPPDFVGVDDVTQTTGVAKFGHAVPLCGLFAVQLFHHSTGVWVHFYPAESPLDLVGLDPCTTYTLSVSHVTELISCTPVSFTFTTEC